MRRTVVIRNEEQGREAMKELFNADRISTYVPSGPFRAVFHRTDLGTGVAVGQATCSTDFAAGAAHLGAFSIDLPLSHPGMLWQQGGHRGTADPRTTAVFGPEETLSIDRCGAGVVLALLIPPQTLGAHLETLLQDQIKGPVRLSPSFRTDTAAGRTWARLMAGLVIDVSAGADTDPPHALLLPPLSEALLTATLLAAEHPWRQRLLNPAPRVRSGAVRRAIEALHADPTRIHTVAELAAVAHCSPRALQEAFRVHLGTTPSRYARHVRLDAAHRELQSADPQSTTIAQVAARFGFPYPSRFAAYYQARFGRYPHQTLYSNGEGMPQTMLKDASGTSGRTPRRPGRFLRSPSTAPRTGV